MNIFKRNTIRNILSSIRLLKLEEDDWIITEDIVKQKISEIKQEYDIDQTINELAIAAANKISKEQLIKLFPECDSQTNIFVYFSNLLSKAYSFNDENPLVGREERDFFANFFYKHRDSDDENIKILLSVIISATTLHSVEENFFKIGKLYSKDEIIDSNQTNIDLAKNAVLSFVEQSLETLDDLSKDLQSLNLLPHLHPPPIPKTKSKQNIRSAIMSSKTEKKIVKAFDDMSGFNSNILGALDEYIKKTDKVARKIFIKRISRRKKYLARKEEELNTAKFLREEIAKIFSQNPQQYNMKVYELISAVLHKYVQYDEHNRLAPSEFRMSLYDQLDMLDATEQVVAENIFMPEKLNKIHSHLKKYKNFQKIYNERRGILKKSFGKKKSYKIISEEIEKTINVFLEEPSQNNLERLKTVILQAKKAIEVNKQLRTFKLGKDVLESLLMNLGKEIEIPSPSSKQLAIENSHIKR